VRFVINLSLLAVGLGLCSCSSTKNSVARNTGNTSPTANIKNSNNNSSRQPFWAQPDNKSPALNTTNGPRAGLGSSDGVKLTAADQPDVNGVLAGRLVEVFGRRPERAYIQVQPADGGAGGKPIDIAAGDDGYFMIPGLTPGRGYMLTAQ